MTALALLWILSVGFTLGVIHALDPDHLMTMAALSAKEEGKTATIRYAALWALGHGGLLIAAAAAVLLFGWQLPRLLPAGAERAVGVILIAAGASLLWLRHPPHGKVGTLRAKAPLAIGLVHGLAGSAAMLALIPATLHHPVMGLAYAGLFSMGVLAGMMGFGVILDRGTRLAATRFSGMANIGRVGLGLGAMGMGAYWLHAA